MKYAGMECAGNNVHTGQAPPHPPLWRLKDGTKVFIRPIHPFDEPLMVKFHESLSADSVYFRYFGPLKLSLRVAHQRLLKVCRDDCTDEIAVVAVTQNARTDEDEIVGVGRLIKFPEHNEVEFAVVVSDNHQGSGLGTHLLRELMEIARHEGYTRVFGYVLPDNRPMLHICEKLGFQRVYPTGDPVVKVELILPLKSTWRRGD